MQPGINKVKQEPSSMLALGLYSKYDDSVQPSIENGLHTSVKLPEEIISIALGLNIISEDSKLRIIPLDS